MIILQKTLGTSAIILLKPTEVADFLVKCAAILFFGKPSQMCKAFGELAEKSCEQAATQASPHL